MFKSHRIKLIWLVPMFFLAGFYFFPLAKIVQVSFARSQTGAWAAFQQAISAPTTWKVFRFTLWQAGLSTLLTLIVGLPGAYLLARYEFKGKRLFRAITSVPFVMPTLVVAAGFNALLGPKGWLNLVLISVFNLSKAPIEFANTLTAILTAHVFYNTTIVLRMVADFWAHLDPRLEQAARALGANGWQAFQKVTLPLLSPVILSAALLIFIFDFTSFGVILILGGPQFATLEVEIFYQTISLFNLPMAATLSLLQLACTLTLTILYTWLSGRLTHPLKIQTRQQTQKRLVNWRQRLTALSILGCLTIILIAPLAALAAQSVYTLEPQKDRSGEIDQGFTLDFYRELSQNRRAALFFVPPSKAIQISLSYAATTMLFSLGLGLPTAWMLAQNQKAWLSRILDPILMLPLGTSAVTLGLGFIVALSQPPLNLSSSPMLIPIAHTLVAFPFVVRSLTPILKRIQPQLRSAAVVLGAAPRQVFRHIELPIIARGLLVAGTFAFTISMGEFGATSLLSRPEFPTIPIVIYRYLSRPGGLNYGQALALSTILMGITAAGMLAIERLRVADIGTF